jgi:hypothetical protein
VYSASGDHTSLLTGPLLNTSARRLAERTSIGVEDGRFIIDNYRTVAEIIDRQPNTVTHGDAHPGNVYFRNGEAGLLDWQAVRRGHPGRELAYTLITSMTTADRQACERDLLATYRRALAAGGGKYILCMPVKAGNEVSDEVLTRPGRYRTVAPNLEVKEVVLGDGERRRRYVVCFNAEEAKRQQAHRAQVLAELEAVLPELRTAGAHSKRVCALRTSERYGKYLTQDRHGRLKLDPAKVRQAERLDGKFVVHSNDDTLTPEDLALGYKQLMHVERAWRLLKSGLRIRPLFHWAPHRICAHVSLTMMALLLERLAERACGDTWRNIRDDLRQIKLVQFSTPQGELWQVTEPLPAAANRLKQLGIPPPPPVLKIDPPPTHTPHSG